MPVSIHRGEVLGEVERVDDQAFPDKVASVDDDHLPDSSSDSASPSFPPHMEIVIRRSYPLRQFDMGEAERIIKVVLEDSLTGLHYNFETFSELTVQLSTKIKDQIKSEMYLPRYKIVASVTVAQLSNLEQAVRIGTCSRPLWNGSTDSYAQASFVSPHLYATGVVYAAYYY